MDEGKSKKQKSTAALKKNTSDAKSKKSLSTRAVKKLPGPELNPGFPEAKDKTKETGKYGTNEARSFHEAVDKFKKLFDDKIKIVKNQPCPATDRLQSKKVKKNNTVDYAAIERPKPMGGTVNVTGKNHSSKQGFSQIISHIQSKLNNHHNRIIKEETNLATLEVLESIEYYRPGKSRGKSKNKLNLSKSKQKANNSKTFSAAKNTDRIHAFESVEEKQETIRREASRTDRQKSTNRRSVSRKKSKINSGLFEKSRGMITERVESIKPRKSSQKYLKRLTTYESSQRTDREKPKAKKKNNKVVKVDKSKRDEKDGGKKNRQKIKKADNHQDSAQRLCSRRIVTSNYLKDRVEKKEAAEGEEYLKYNNNFIVSSSSDLLQDEEHLLLDEAGVSSRYQGQNSSEAQGNQSFNSVIVMSGQEEDGLQLAGQVMSSQQMSGNISECASVVARLEIGHLSEKNDQHSEYLDCLQVYLRGFLDRLKTFQEIGPNRAQQITGHKSKVQGRNEKDNTTGEHIVKKVMNVEEVLQEEKNKWLSFKESLEKIKRGGDFGEELEKIIMEAEINHLTLQQMQIKQVGQPTNPSWQSARAHKNLVLSMSNHSQCDMFEDEPTKVLKAPAPSNQINININISDKGVKIESPPSRVLNTIAIKMDPPKLGEAQQPEGLMCEITTSKQGHVSEQKSRCEGDYAQSESISPSELEFHMLLNEYANKAEKSHQPPQQAHIPPKEGEHPGQLAQGQQGLAGQAPLKVEEPTPTEQKFKKRKLSYDEAPMQIKRIFNTTSNDKSEKSEHRQISQKKEVQNLDLSEILSNKGIYTSGKREFEQASDSAVKRVKIMEELKSPKIRSLAAKHHIERSSSLTNNTCSQEQTQAGWLQKGKIKINLLKTNTGFGSEGQLDVVRSVTSDGKSRDERPNQTIVFRRKDLQQHTVSDKKQPSGSQPSATKPVEVSKVPLSQLIASQREKESEVEFKIYDEHYLERESQEGQDPPDSTRIYKQLFPWLKEDRDEGGENLAPPQPSPAHKQTQQERSAGTGQVSGEEANFVVSRPGYDLEERLQQCEYALFDQLTFQFFHEMVTWLHEGQYGLTPVGKQVFNLINGDNIDIKVYDDIVEPEQQGSPFYRIQRYRDVQEPTEDIRATIRIEPAISMPTTAESAQEELTREFQSYFGEEGPMQGDGDEFTQKAYCDNDYTYRLVLQLMDFIEAHPDLKQDFMAKLRIPLGADTLWLLKIMRMDDSSEIPDPDNQLSEFNGQDEFDYSPTDVISVQTTVAFEQQMTRFEDTNNTQQIYNQVVYDQVNSLLLSLKPYGTKGLPSLNFAHRYKRGNSIDWEAASVRDPNLRRTRNFRDIKESLEDKLESTLRIRLGLLREESGNRELMVYSLGRLVAEHCKEMDEQFQNQDEGEFLVRHALMHQIEDFILMEEACDIVNTLFRERAG